MLQVWRFIKSLVKENTGIFRAGSLGGFGVWFAKLPIAGIHLFDLWQLLLKTLTAACAALATGLFAALAADIYKHKIQHRWFKNKNKENERPDNEERA